MSHVPYHCPFCGEQDLRPLAEESGGWHCRACLRGFSVRFLGLRSSATPVATPELAAAGAALVAPSTDPVDQARSALAWAHETFGPQLVVASSMGDEVLVHLASQVAPGIDVLFIDTGYHFAETLGTAAAFEATRPIRLVTITPRRSVAEQDAAEGPALYSRNPDSCCAQRKVEPLERGLAGYAAWVTGMRRVDAPTRTDIEPISWDAKRGKVKVNPLAAWTDEDVDTYAQTHGVLLNPLRQIGYTSIGCEPCTKPTLPGEDPRAGRWAGRPKTECGLHT